MHKIIITIILLTATLIAGCGTPEERFEKQLDKAMSEEFSYLEYNQDGFSILYPDWPATESEIQPSVTKGYCSVTINQQGMIAKQWYNMIKDTNLTIIKSNPEENYVKHSAKYQDFTMISENKIYDCSDYAYAVTITCIEQAAEKAEEMINKIYGSASCKEEVKEIAYSDFTDNDFEIQYPDWDEMELEEQRILGLSKGVCSLIVDKHNALPEDIYDWMTEALEIQEDHNMIDSSVKDDIYYITYERPYEEYITTSETKIFYCNYQSYITQVICVNEFMNDEFEQIKDKILESSECIKEYEIPTPKVIEEKKQEVEEKEPEVIEEIEDDIVKTNAGNEFGIDEEMVVYFINNNAFFTKILKDFSKANLVIEDNDRKLKLKVRLDSDGKITLLDDGEYSDADITLIVPLRDALNIFSNAQNLNPMTLLSFAANVRTIPENVKNEVIQKFLRGEYN